MADFSGMTMWHIGSILKIEPDIQIHPLSSQHRQNMQNVRKIQKLHTANIRWSNENFYWVIGLSKDDRYFKLSKSNMLSIKYTRKVFKPDPIYLIISRRIHWTRHKSILLFIKIRCIFKIFTEKIFQKELSLHQPDVFCIKRSIR